MISANRKQLYVMLVILLSVAGFQVWWLKSLYHDQRKAFSALATQAVAKAYATASFQQVQRLKGDSVLKSRIFQSPALQEYNMKKQFLKLTYNMNADGSISHIAGQNLSHQASKKKDH